MAISSIDHVRTPEYHSPMMTLKFRTAFECCITQKLAAQTISRFASDKPPPPPLFPLLGRGRGSPGHHEWKSMGSDGTDTIVKLNVTTGNTVEGMLGLYLVWHFRICCMGAYCTTEKVSNMASVKRLDIVVNTEPLLFQ